MRSTRTVALAATAVTVLAAVGCGSGDGLDRRPVGHHAQPPQPQTSPPRKDTVIVFRRVRYEGATLRTLYLHRDGTMDIEVPGGGTGAARFDGRVQPATLRAVERLVRRTPWNDLSRRKVVYNRSGAYFLLRHAGTEHVAMADGMSADLVPLVDRLNGILNGDGQASRRTIHRFNIP